MSKISLVSLNDINYYEVKSIISELCYLENIPTIHEMKSIIEEFWDGADFDCKEYFIDICTKQSDRDIDLIHDIVGELTDNGISVVLLVPEDNVHLYSELASEILSAENLLDNMGVEVGIENLIN